MSRSAALLALSLFALPSVASADVRLPAVIGDHMVLQHSSEVPLWGWADPGESISIKASWGAQENTIATGKGHWRVLIDTPRAGGPFTIDVQGANRLRLKDVLCGEVWVCSGQSNMEWSLARVSPDGVTLEDPEGELSVADQSRIRLFDVDNVYSPSPRQDCKGSWKACSRESAAPFSAVGYFFGRELLRELDVPIGLIGSNWGGTVAEAWTSEEALAGFPEFDEALRRVARLRANPDQADRELEKLRATWWRALRGTDSGSRQDAWAQPDFNDARWKSMDLPGGWESSALGNFDGIVWYRREIVVPESWAGRGLVMRLGPIDDMDTTWFDGQKVGGLEHPGVWQTPRVYRVPGELATPGRHVIAVRVLDTGGGGGFHGGLDSMSLAPARGGRNLSLPLTGSWRYAAGAPLSKLRRFPDRPGFHQNVPTALSNGMLEPIIPFGIRGAIWYQGESNRTRAEQYERLFPAMITDWRQRWGRGDFPFYFVQIAPFRYGGDTGQAAALRDAQRKTLALPNTGMASTMDIGNPADIHPRNKIDVGKRLALWALAKTYARDGLVHSGPLYRSMSFEDDSIRLDFDHVGGGLVARGGALTHFTVAGPDRRFVEARAVIDGRSVVVSSPEVSNPVAVRYGWGTADEPNLFNRAGLPASSFRTDSWGRKRR